MGSSKPAEPTTYEYNYYMDFAVLLSENPINRIVKIFENGKLIYNNGSTGNTRWASMTLYNGDQTGASSIIQAKQGVKNTPAWLGYSYVVFKEYALKNSGNAIPNLEFIVEERSSMTLSQALTSIMRRSGFKDTEFNIQQTLATVDLKGYVSSGPASTTSLLEDLMQVHSIYNYEYNGVIYFVKRSTIPEYVVDSKHLSAREGTDGEDTKSSRLVITNLDSSTFPREINIQYPDYDQDLEWGSQMEIRVNNVDQKNKVLTVDTQITMSGSQARERVSTIMWQKWSEDKTIQFTLAPSNFMIQESDTFAIVLENQRYVVRVESVTIGANYVVECQGTIVGLCDNLGEATYYTQNISAADPIYTEPTLYEVPNLNTFLIDCGPLRYGDEETPLIYFGQSISSGNEFLGASVYKALNLTGTYTLNKTTANQTTSGTLLSSVPKFEGYGWDRHNTILVKMDYGTLQTRTQEQVLQGLNHCMIGGEVIGYRDATLVDIDTYKLSYLIRARRGTDSELHSIGDNFISLYSSEISVIRGYLSDYNINRYFKWVPVGAEIGSVTPREFNYQAKTVREFKPTHVNGTLLNNNWTLTWKRRTRVLWSPFGTTECPEPEGREYLVKIYSHSTYAEVLRTISVSNLETATYTASQQLTDFGNYRSFLYVGIVQLNKPLGIEGLEKREYITNV